MIGRGASLDVRMDVGWGFLPGDGSAVNWAAEGGHLDIVKRLVAAGAKADIYAKKPAWFGTGGTPVVMGSGFQPPRRRQVPHGHSRRGRRLMGTAGADDAGSAEGVPGWDAFLCACERSAMDVARHFMLREGFSATRKNRHGLAPIHRAALGESEPVMALLREKGADLDAVDPRGWAPLHFAAEQKLKKSAVWLRKNGASLNARNKDGKTPLDVAKAKAGKDVGEKEWAVVVQALDSRQDIPKDDTCVVM